MTTRSTSLLGRLAACIVAGLFALALPGAAGAADATAPTVSFGSWTESSPWAHYDGSQDVDRLWFNPNQSGSASAMTLARDPDTGVAFFRWPTPPAGWSPAGSDQTTGADTAGLIGQYWNSSNTTYSSNFAGNPTITRIDPDINFNWGTGSPHASIPTSAFSARWTGKLVPPDTGYYYFQTSSNDGVRVAVNGAEVLRWWNPTGAGYVATQCPNVPAAGGTYLTAGVPVDIVVEYFEDTTNTASMQLRWRRPTQTATYRAPTGCDATPAIRDNAATGFTGAGSSVYPAIPASAFTVGGGVFNRTFSWVGTPTPASGGTVDATANNNDTPQDTSANLPIEFAADSTPPVAGGSGALDIGAIGWGTTGANTLAFPRADTQLSDAGASSASYTSMTRMLQRKDGVADGAGSCNTGAGTWTDIGTPVATVTSITGGIVNVPAANTCSEYRYRITDAVGNILTLTASGYRGWDTTPPTGAVASITEDSGNQYQVVRGANQVYVNTNQAGAFTVTTNPTDAHAGVASITHESPGVNWTPVANTDTFASPWEQQFTWTAGAANAGARRIRITDGAGNNPWITNAFTITRDITAPTGGTFTPPNGTTWRNSLSVPFNMTAAPTETGSGIASYQLQREQAPWNGTACDPFDGVSYVNIGAPVLGDPPPLLTGVNDTSVADNTCYRYRVEVYDQVTNIGTMTNTNSVRVDDTDPTGSFNSLPAFASGTTFPISGAAGDTMSGVASITLRLENLDVAGPIVPIYTDAAAPFWGTFNWNTTSVTDGNYRIHLDVTDVAGNVTTDADTYDVLVDNTAPTLVHDGFTEGANPEYQHIDPVATNHRAWVKTTGIGAANPSITANFTPADTQSGIDYVTTPAAPGGGTPWSPTTATQVQDPGPYSQAYAWTAGVANFGTRNATATNNAGVASATAPFTITADNTAPGGGSVTPAPSDDPWHTSTSIVLTIVSATDAASGIDTQRVMRDELARNVAGNCGTGAPWPNTYATQIGTAGATLPATITDNSLVSGMCYRYRIEATDNVGNVSNSASSTRFVVDSIAPTATIDTTPTSPFQGTLNVAGTSTDGPTDGSASGVDTVTLHWLNLDDLSSGTVNVDASAEPAWSISWNTSARPDGNYRLIIDVADVATNTVTSIATRDVIVDNSPPVITYNAIVEGAVPDCQHVVNTPTPTIWLSVAAAAGCAVPNDFAIRADAVDTPGGVAYVQFPVANMNTNNITPDAPAAPNTIAGRDTTASPFYEWHYTYTSTVSGSPNLEYVTATGNQGLSTVAPPATPPATPHLSINVVRDVTGPTGHTITPPGGTASPAWWSNANSPSVAFSLASLTDAAAGVRTGAHVLERQTAPGPNCTVWSGYTPVGTPGLPSPYADASTPEDTCYQYRLRAYDNVNNSTVATSTSQVKVDRTLPTGTINPVPAYVTGNSVSLGGTSGDNWSGVASISVRLGAGPATACTPAVAASWTCSWDTTATSNGAKTLVLVVTDRAGNVLDTQTQSTYVDNELPAVSVSLAAGANPGAQHLVPGPTPRIYVNTNTGTNGTFVATATPTDAFSGVASVQFPDLLTGWTRTPPSGLVATPGPYEVTYGWTGSATTNDPGAMTVQATDNAANLNTAPFEVVADTTGPSAVTLDYADGPTTTPSIDFTPGTESTGSGMRTWRIERQEASVAGPNTCSATWSGFTPQVADPLVSPWTDGSAALNMCYRYRIVSIDNVGNETIVGDATGDTVSIEPAGIVVVESAASTAVAEGGATDTYTVRLRTRPTGDVVVTLGSDAQVDTNAPTLTFTTANWNVAQTVTVTAVQDPDDEVPDPHSGTITHVAASSDGDYDTLNGADVVASITDDDVSSFIVSADQASVAVLEAGATSDTYTIRLASRPTADVVVTLGNSDGEVAFAPATLTFDTTNWNTAQTVTITAVDDDYDESPNAHTGVVTHSVASSDALYAAQSIANTTAAVTDDDAAGLTVTPTGGLLVTEGSAATDQYTIRLNSEPVGTIVINIVVTDAADASTDVSMLTFDSTDWNVPKVVTVSSIDDAIVEGPETHTISNTITAPNPADSTYVAVGGYPISVDVVDDDIPGIEVTPTTGLTATEGGAGASYQVRLETEPTADVTIAFGTGAQVDPIASLVFTPLNWNTYQTVGVVATQDDIDEVPDPHTGTIVQTVTSPDATYDGWSLADQSVAITDDDQADVTIDDGGGVDLDEANVLATDTISVVLESEPVGAVTVTATPDAQVTVSAPVTFDDTDWNTPKTITVTAVDDDIDEAAIHPGAITFDVTGADPLYAAINPAQVDADVADDDTAAITVAPGTLVLDEDLPATDSFTVRLESQPVTPVTITIATDAQATASASTLTFNSGNWNADQTVTVTAVDDPTVEDDPHPSSVTIQATAGDPAYLSLPLQTKAATIADNDTPGVTVADGGGVAVAEGAGTDSYTVVLDRQPQADVVVTVASDTQVTGLPATLTFTTANWNVAQVVTVTAVDDDIDEGTGTHTGTITHTVASSDPRWATVTSAAAINVDVADDDVAGVTVAASSPYALSEDTPAPGTTVTYTVVLDSEPTADVDVALTIPGDLDASPATFTFTSADWDTPQTVTVGAIDDAVTEALVHTRTITHATTSGDTRYAGLTPAAVAFDVADNDIPGIDVSESTLTATEGGATDSFTVVLETQPTADVVVDLTGTQVGFDVDPLTFTTTNWNVPQTVVVTATDDDVDEHPDTHAGLVELDVTSADPVYAAWPLTDITVAITDDDTAGVTITPGATAIAVDEASAATATYDVVLDTEPTGTVTITPTTADGQTLVTPATLTFDSTDWNIAKQFTVAAVDDPVDEANVHPGVITHAASSSDPHYGATLAIDDQAVDVSDDDTSGVTVTPTSGLALDEAAVATTASFTVVLDTQPAGNVTIDLTTADDQTSVAPDPLTFTPGNWSAAQTVTVTVVDDAVDEGGPHTGLVVLDAAAATDPAYDAVDPADVTADIADDDIAGVIITESAGSTDVDEGATTDTYLVRLATQPTADVDIDLTGGLDATTVPVQLTFTAANWATDQVVTVHGTPDFVIEGAHTQAITHVASSSDASYDATLAIADVVANVTDDDVAGATITPTSVAVTEGGATATYDVVLDAEPASDVTIALTPNAELLVSTPALVFTTANWNTPQTVTVTANDDFVVEASPHAGLVTHAMTSGDANFNVAVADVTAAITDDDVPGVTVTQAPPNLVTEGGTGTTFDVVLDSKPTADVTVTFTEGGQLDPIADVTFTDLNWNVAQTVSIDAYDDFIAEGAHATTITLDTASADGYYAPGTLTIDDVDVDIADNDNAGVLVVPSSGLAGSEGGAPVSYVVSLTSQPIAPVTVTFTGDADGAPTPTTLTFDGTDWATPKSVDVAIVDDAIAEGAHDTTITHDVSSTGDPLYDTTVTAAPQVVAITDNDTAAVTFTPALPGPLAIGEGGPTATYTVVLTSEPTGDVTIDVASLAGQAAVAPTTLTFTNTDWASPQTITVTADDDQVAEVSPHAESLTHTAGGADPSYAGLTLGDMDLAITDNDVPGVLIDATLPDTAASEGGLGDTVRVRLATEPTADVTVTLTGSEVTLTPATLTFTSANWNTPQDVTVDAIDDDIFEGPHAGTIDALTGSVGDSFYAGVSASQHAVAITDDDTAGVIVTQASPNTLDELTPLAGQSYSVQLESEPLQPVDVLVAPDAQLASATTALTFTPADWDTPQPVTVTPVDDAIAEASPHPGAVAHDTTSLDPAYGAGVLAIDDADFSIADDDTPGVTVTPAAPHAVTEGGATSTYTIVLESEPTGDVTIAPVSTQLEWSVPDITFTTADWSTPQTVTLRAIDDTDDEPDPHTGTIVHAITTTDLNYQGVAVVDASADITDNDTSDLVATPVGAPSVDEAGSLPAAQYVLTLTSTPTADVTVTLATAAPAQVAFTPATVTLTAANWNSGVTVDVTAVDDQVDEDSPHVGTITHAMASGDADFDGETGPSQDVDVVDDDTAAVTITETSGSTGVAEDGSLVDDYDVVLMTQPTADVTITLATPGSQVAVTPATLTFTTTNWNTPQNVDVTAVDDSIFEGPHSGTITHVASSADPNYDPTASPIADVVANVLDDDTPGITVTPLGGTFEVAEGGAADTLVVTLDTEPTSPVTIDLATPDLETTVAPAQVVLDAANWNTGVNVDVTAVDDGFIEGPHTGDVTFAVDAAASDDDYDTVTEPDATAQVTDNDSATIEVDEGDGIALDEGAPATTDTLTVRLGASPDAGETVDVDLTELAPGGQVTFTPATLTFDDATWSAPQTVTVTVVDDDVDEASPHSTSIQYASTSAGDPDFDNLTAADTNVTIADDDTAGITITPATIAVAEAGTTTQSVDVQLQSEPTGPVEVVVTGDAQAEVVGGPITLTFTPANWSTPQPVDVRALQDDDDELDPHPASITFAIGSPGAADPTYDALADEVRTADVADDDTSDVVLTLASGTEVDEAAAGTVVEYDVALATRPTGDVTITFVPNAQLEVVGGPLTLTFTQANWSSAQQVQVRAADDPIVEGTHPGLLAMTMGGADATYAALTPAAVSIDVLDDDTAGVTVTQVGAPGQVDEANAATTVTYDVVLDSQPIADVDVTITTGAQVEVVGGDTTLTFTPADWNAPQPVVITAVDDLVTEVDPHPAVVTHASDSVGDANYATAAALTIADATFEVADDDQPGFTLTPAAPSLTVDEAGATSQTYQLAIDSIPAGDVVVDIATASPDVTVTPASITFDAGNAGIPQDITVTAVDDTLVDPAEAATITHVVNAGASDPGYTTPVPPSIADATVAITDDDVAAVLVDVLDGIAVAEPATTDTYEVRLGAEPTDDVTVAFAADPAQLEPIASLTFTPGNWNAPQVVTVQARDDLLVEADPHVVPVATTTTSNDTAFAGLVVAPTDVAIDDDDVPAFDVTDPADMTMTEDDVAGSVRTITVRLATQPATPVTVVASGDGQVGFLTSPVLVLNAGNFATGVQLQVQPIQDGADELDPHPGVVSFAVQPTSDAAYASLPIAPRTFQITDSAADVATIACDDGPDWDDTSGRAQLAEDPGAATHDIGCYLTIGSALPAGRELTVDVTVTTGQVTTDRASVTFTSADGASASQLVTFTAVDDALAEGTHPASISFDVSSTDPIYDLLTIAPADLDIADNDAVGSVVAPAGPIAVAEGGATETASIVLSSQPTDPVTVTIDGGAQLSTSPATLTFQPASWNVPQDFSINATDDPIDEPDGHAGQVTFTLASDDAPYAAHVPTPLDATITDNDTPGVVVTPTDAGNAVSEAGGTDTMAVRLGTRPTDDVVVTVTPGAQLTSTPAAVTFTTANWNDPQTLTVGAVQDTKIEGEHTGTLTFALTSNDGTYAAGAATTPASQPVTITDDDLAGVVIVETDAKTTVAEAGATDTYTLALTGEPTADVTIATNGGTQVTTAPATVTFTPANWNTPQVIKVSAVQDSIDETDPHSGPIQHSATTDAAGWAGANLSGVASSIADDDEANIVAKQTDDSTRVLEGNSRGDVITFALSSQPTQDVTIVATGDAQVSVPTKPVVLTPAKWKDAIELQVIAVDDEEVEGDHEGTVTFKVTSDDGGYAKATVAPVTVLVGDNDRDPALPTTQEEDEDERGTSRSPRSSVPPATVRPPGSDEDDDTTSRRTTEGSTRTDEGSERTRDGVEGAATDSGGDEEGVRTGRQLGGEVVAATEEEVAKRKSPVERAMDWLRRNWILAALIVGGGAVLAGTGAWMLRGDPIKAAQRAAAAKTAADVARRGAKHHPNPRLRKKKRKKGDDDDEDEDAPGAKKR